MAEANRTGILAKAQKRLSRTKTKVLQTFGKADKSTDESFDELVQKTEKQQEVAQHLQKEIKTYLHCVRALGQASKSLATAVSQTYEEEWTDAAEVKKSLESVDLLWTDYQQNVHEKVLDVLNDYIASFPSLKARIAKRGRKMVDYDNSRHNLAVLQTAKKTDEAKITKAQEDLNESKRIYEELHKELCADLPDFYNSRITFYADIFQKLFGQESILHCELATISDTVNTINEKLATEFLHFAYKPRRPLSQSVSDNSQTRFYATLNSEEQELNGESSPKHQPLSASAIQSTPSRQQDTVSKGHFYSNEDEAKSPVRINGSIDNKEEPTGKTRQLPQHKDIDDEEEERVPENSIYEVPGGEEEEEAEAYQDNPSNRPLFEPPPDALYQVEATHAYYGEDEDELSFEAGDIIYVIPFENEDEQDEGWQMGVRQKDGIKGVFPENFTRQL
ncbi:hypothetical protein C0Q70_02703 [Pomacea canaliculata]|uniref:SH3 domain-containing protein n=1 Tax=Pomacea canaliculata TaxID=400727 RepID=A0A2T7PQS5_POMCA|nr:amphiphysin-like isoform X3 [Pomacea canaliculata]PVD35740.1 hypothetical protein C0Q70_02703 [Pomacea canaliculata]